MLLKIKKDKQSIEILLQLASVYNGLTLNLLKLNCEVVLHYCDPQLQVRDNDIVLGRFDILYLVDVIYFT